MPATCSRCDRAEFGRAVGTAIDADPADLALQIQQISTEPSARIGVSLKEDQPAILTGGQPEDRPVATHPVQRTSRLQVRGVTVLQFPSRGVHLLPKRAADPGMHRTEVAVAKCPAHDWAVGGVGDPVELDEVDVVGGILTDRLAVSRPAGHGGRRDQVAPAGQQGDHNYHEHAPRQRRLP